MKKIINTYNKKLVFPKYDFSIGSKEVKEVSNEQSKELLNNKWIKEAFSEKIKKTEDPLKKEKNKGRK